MDINITLRFSWCFFKFVYICYILIAFDNLTSCWVCWLQVTLVIYFTYCVVTSWDQFISLAFEFNLLWTVVYNCVVVFVYWLSIFVGYIWLDCLAFCINVVYIDITIHFFINISDGWFWFSNFTFNWIRWFQVSIFVNFTYWVVTFWYDLIGLTIFILDSFRFFTIFSSVIWCVIWWVWCILTRFLNLFTIYIYISNNYFTLFKFVHVSYILITFNNLTSCWVCWLQVTLIIYFTYCVVTSWDQFISLTFEFNLLWTVVYDCIVVFVHWLFVFVGYIWLDCLAFCIYIVNINITLRCFFKFVDVCDVFILFCHFSSCRIWRLKVTFLIYFTNFVSASWD